MPSPKGVWVCNGRFPSKAQREVRSHLRRVSMRQTQLCHSAGFIGFTWPLDSNRETCQDIHCLIHLQLTNVSSKPAAGCCQLWTGGQTVKSTQVKSEVLPTTNPAAFCPPKSHTSSGSYSEEVKERRKQECFPQKVPLKAKNLRRYPIFYQTIHSCLWFS